MEISTLSKLAAAEFGPKTTYLNTASCGLLPRRTVEAVKDLVDENFDGTRTGAGSYETVDVVRAAFGRIVGVGADRVATGGSVALHVGLIAASLEPGSEVLLPEGDFSSLVTPFAHRADLRTRYVPLADLADAVRPGTALVAFSVVQSADGRVADAAGVREAAATHGARTLVDATQAAGWLPFDAGAYDYTVTGGFKFLVCPRGTSFLTVAGEAQPTLPAIFPGWVAGADRDGGTYGPVTPLSASARAYDEAPAFLAYHGAERSLALIEEAGTDALHAHATGLAAQLREGLAGLGHETVPGESAIVAVPGLGDRARELERAAIVVSARAGNLRLAFHLYNTQADVDRVLDVLGG
ncbi:aminotransferase class V-fold PLP-dependent enzyme [uncultured Streptomyces sp.]|uniref:aminotransferase class V-fold PLP-dependent enzyme n=1 Tax=uncultured Streptomyces sp. TaxID=174707 RepID=UPI002620FA68|nr:aminotransferase class V-fold PLP-dependent enzyme [uncultured Streptomyces sp.]